MSTSTYDTGEAGNAVPDLRLVDSPTGNMTKRRLRRAAKRARRAIESPAAGVVSSVAEQTAAAEALAEIRGQDRLMDPATNPAVREHADRLRDDEHRQELSARHRRKARGIRVEDRRAADAERALEVIYEARRMGSPAQSVLALHRGRRIFLGITQAASLALSVGSATGPAALATQHNVWAGVGYIAEIGLTGLSTTAVMYKAHLSAHAGARVTGWRSWILWLLMIAPLSGSIVANAITHGFVGVFCSIGAALFALLSYVVGDLSSEALARRAAEVTGADEDHLRTVATGGGADTTPARSVPADADTAGATKPKTSRTRVKVERADAPAKRAAITEDKKLELEAGTPKAVKSDDPTPGIDPAILQKAMSHPKWQRAVDIFTAALDAGTELSARRLTEEIGLKNRDLASKAIFYVKIQRNGVA